MQYKAPAQPKRMAYGQPGQTHPEQMARDELFAGADSAQRNPQHLVDENNTQQLMQHAVDTHKETTATAQRALRIVEQTKEAHASTAQALVDQRQQMYRIEDDMQKIGEDLTYSERILRFMRLCCCVGFFCSCCTEPSRNERDKQWRGPSSGPQQPTAAALSGQQRTAKQRKQQQEAELAAKQQATLPGVSTRGLAEAGFADQATVINTETAKQDHYLDQISQGLDQLKAGAQMMNRELGIQAAHAQYIHDDADKLGSKMQKVNREGFRGV
jgi:hypothetical protein